MWSTHHDPTSFEIGERRAHVSIKTISKAFSVDPTATYRQRYSLCTATATVSSLGTLTNTLVSLPRSRYLAPAYDTRRNKHFRKRGWAGVARQLTHMLMTMGANAFRVRPTSKRDRSCGKECRSEQLFCSYNYIAACVQLSSIISLRFHCYKGVWFTEVRGGVVTNGCEKDSGRASVCYS